jgi:hypothetical protein
MQNHFSVLPAFFGIGIILAILFFSAIIIGIEVVIIYAVIHAIRKYDDPMKTVDARSGKGKMSEVPEEIKGWNWAAAFLPTVWGVYHRSWLFLLRYVPFLSWVWWIIMGIKGNEWAWKNNQWESVERFKRAQARWKPVGILCFILNLLWIPYIIIFLILGPLLSLNNVKYDQGRLTPSYEEQLYRNDFRDGHDKYNYDDSKYFEEGANGSHYYDYNENN